MLNTIKDKIEKNKILAPLTTIKLGGKAEYFIKCETVEEIKQALLYAKENNLRVHILGGGSNTIFTEANFKGLVIKIDLKGITFKDNESSVIATAQAGENWDSFVKVVIEKGLAGIECLSGIPGSVGATPMQNVGAYGQSVSDSIIEVQALDRQTLNIIKFLNKDCLFEYRSSRFKYEDKDKYIITEVSYELIPNGIPTIKYPELLKTIQKDFKQLDIGRGKESLEKIRNTVIGLRKNKSMIVDKDDPYSQSCGSFFMSPVVTPEEFSNINKKWKQHNESDIQNFPEGDNLIKIPAGWLIEKSGIEKGYRKGSVGVSPKHALALVNYGNDAKELLALEEYIKNKVKDTFGLDLKREPVLVK